MRNIIDPDRTCGRAAPPEDWAKVLPVDLGPADVHVWTLSLDAALHPQAAWSVLSERERARALRFLSPSHRDAFVIGRGWVKGVLAGYLRCGAAEVQFAIARHGKPFLRDAAGLHFSWSHARSIWTLAVTAGGPIGVDIEGIDDDLDWRQPASVAFHENELAFVEAAESGSLQLERFYAVWTRKEALFKALGSGLHDGMEHVAVVDADGGLRAALSVLDGGLWRLTTLPAVPDLVAALATGFAAARIRCCKEQLQ